MRGNSLYERSHGTSAATAAVEISSKPTANMSCSGGVCTPTAKKAVLNVGDLAAMLASGDATVKSDSVAQDIEIDAKLSWTSASRLTLDSYRSIAFNKPLIVAGTGALTITTNDGGSGGDFQFFGKGHVQFRNFASESGRLRINGNEYSLAKSIREMTKFTNTGVGNFALARDIDDEGRAYTQSPMDGVGRFEGLGNTIANLSISDPNGNHNVALVGEGTIQTLIRDVNLLSVNIQGTGIGQKVGTLIAVCGGCTIQNVLVTGSVTGSGAHSEVGGVCGGNAGTIVRVGSDVVVEGGDSSSVGGLFGFSGAAEVFGEISESYALGPVTGGDDSSVGGLIGDDVGGLIESSYSLGAVTGGNNALVGGLIGKNEDGNTFPRIAWAYSTGSVVGGSGATVGGMTGQDVVDTQNIDAYWDLDTSGISDPTRGAGNIANDPGITGLSDAQLKSGLPAGFDKKIWKQNAAINGGYPYLIANPPPH